MKIKRAAISILISAVSLSIYADGVIELYVSEPRLDYDARIRTYKPTGGEEYLRSPAFPPTDLTLFLPTVYSSDLPVTPASAPNIPVTEQQLRAQVNKIAGQLGLQVMDDPVIQVKIRDPRLRAALATTTDSILGGTTDAVKRDIYASVTFGHLSAGDSVAAHVVDDGAGHFNIIVNENYQHEDIRLLGILLGHEAFHQDTRLSVREELIAHTFETLAYARHVIKDPMLACQGTELTRFLNTVAMGLLNTRQPDGSIHLLEGRDEDIWPDSNSSVDYLARNFVETGLGEDTPGNEALLYAMQKLVEDKKLAEANFDDNTLTLLDAHINTLLNPKKWVALAEALKLDTDA